MQTHTTEAKTFSEALEQAIRPIDERIRDLQQDWDLRPGPFWYEILTVFLPSIREAVIPCLDLVRRDPSLLLIPNLQRIQEELEEAGILLTAYQYSPSESDFPEQALRVRQRILHTLQRLSRAVHKLEHGHAGLT